MLCASVILSQQRYHITGVRLLFANTYRQVDVVEKIDEMGETVNGYQAQCKKLPKALREWPAYLDCRKTIDDFLEMLPLFQVRATS